MVQGRVLERTKAGTGPTGEKEDKERSEKERSEKERVVRAMVRKGSMKGGTSGKLESRID